MNASRLIDLIVLDSYSLFDRKTEGEWRIIGYSSKHVSEATIIYYLQKHIFHMLAEKPDYKLYKSKHIDLKLKVYASEAVDTIYVNYKGYNLAVPMMIWEFGAECIEWSIDNLRMVGKDLFKKYFVVMTLNYILL